jgi:dihydrofolate reductase
MSFSIIAAIARNGIIGKGNKIPWDLPEDLEYFYKLIRGKPVVMGRKTYESLGNPIKNSENIVLSCNQSLQLPGCVVVHSIADVLTQYQNVVEEVIIIGGTLIYEQFLPLVDKMYLTLIDNDVDGDAYFPEWQKGEWIVTDRKNSKFGMYSYSFVVLQLIARNNRK